MSNVFSKDYLMTAGPTPLPPAVSQVMAEPILYHRAPAFVEVYARVLQRLRAVFQTENEVLMFAASGTGAMESAVANLVAPGDVALVASCGKFGQRWAELCDAYGADTRHIEVEWGQPVDPEAINEALAEAGGRVRVVFTTQSETSTGAVNDVRAITEVAHRHNAIACFDAVSGLGVVALPTDVWEVDVVVSGSQKALMCPPGLAFAAVSERALEVARDARGRGARSYYFDWDKTLKGQLKDPPDSPFTPAVTLVRALDVALQMIERETLEGRGRVRATRVAGARRPRGRRGARSRDLPDRARERQRRDGGEGPRRRRRDEDPEDDAGPLPRHDRGRAGAPQGQDRAHRPLRLLRRLRRAGDDRRARDDAQRARSRRFARRRRRGRAAGLPRGGRPSGSAGRLVA
jgi:aspartate aminotransferase-like enzyme